MGESRNFGEGPCSEMAAEGGFRGIVWEAAGNCYLEELMGVWMPLEAYSWLSFKRSTTEAPWHIASAYLKQSVSHLSHLCDFCGTCCFLDSDLQSIYSTILVSEEVIGERTEAENEEAFCYRLGQSDMNSCQRVGLKVDLIS